MSQKTLKWSLLLATGLLACAPTQPATHAKGEVRTMEVKTLGRNFFQRLFRARDFQPRVLLSEFGEPLVGVGMCSDYH